MPTITHTFSNALRFYKHMARSYGAFGVGMTNAEVKAAVHQAMAEDARDRIRRSEASVDAKTNAATHEASYVDEDVSVT